MKLCQLAPRIAASLKAFHDLSEKCFNIGSGCQDTNSLWRDKHTREVEVREHRARVECLERLSIIGERLGDRFFLSCHTDYVLRLPNFFAAASRRDGYTMALEEAQDLHLLREFDEEFLIPFEMMNLCRIAARKFAHRFDTLPIGDRHELGFVLAVLAQCLDTERLSAERLDTGFVLVGVIARGSPAPDSDNGRPFEARWVHRKLLLMGNNRLRTLRKAHGRVRIEDNPPFAAPSDHLHLDPVDCISASELRLSCAADGVGPGAQHDLARTGGTAGENEPLPRSLGAWFHLRLRPRRATFDADIDPVDSTACPCPSPTLFPSIALP